MGQQYSAPHFKTHARNIEFRCQTLTNKRQQEIRAWEKKIAALLKKNLDESARLECLQMLRFERYLVCYKLFTLAGRTLVDSVGIITKAQVCPFELLDACCCIIFATDAFSEIPELKGVTEQLYAKFGEDWVARVRKTKENVNPNLLRAMTDPNPIKADMIVFLRKLGKRFNVEWEPKEGFEDETLGCIKMFPPHHMDDGTTDIYISLDGDEEPPADQEEPRGGEEQVVDEQPPAYEEPPKSPEPVQQPTPPAPKNELRGQYYYIDPNPPARYDPTPAPAPAPAPIPQPQPQPQPQPEPQPQRISAYPAMAPQQGPIAAYPAMPQQQPQQPQGPIAAYPAMPSQAPPQQQPQQQAAPAGETKDAATLALERRLAMLSGK